jgi:hypothetical protein
MTVVKDNIMPIFGRKRKKEIQENIPGAPSKTVTVTDKEGNVVKSKMKNKTAGIKYKKKIKKDGVVKEVRTVHGKRKVEKGVPSPPPNEQWKNFSRFKKYGGCIGPNKVL